ncbi:hypothetical protein PINS_up009167 [Pythium insidiosum]|nr:hypothetical protein PINS_up009167 [Pythium insidiosum]
MPFPPAGPVATPITRFLTKQTFGFIPRPSFASPSADVCMSAPASPLSTPHTSEHGNHSVFRLPPINNGSVPHSPVHSAGPSSPLRQSFALPVGESLTRLMDSASLSCSASPSPSPKHPRSSTFTLPPLKRACPSPKTPLPSLKMSHMTIEDVCLPFRYQRSVSCPSDAMTRNDHQHPEPIYEAAPVPPIVTPQLTDIPRSRVARSTSDAVGTVMARREAHVRARFGSIGSDCGPSTAAGFNSNGVVDHHPLASLAESAVQRSEQDRWAVDSPRDSAPVHDYQVAHNSAMSGRRNSTCSTSVDSRREKKLCGFPECTSNAVTRGLCISHGGGRRCQRKGCTRGAQSKGLCVAHGGGRICKAKGCSNIQRSMGLCIRHGGGKRCSVPGCQKGVVRQDLCTAHGGKRKCKVEDCNKHVKKKGLCRSHANSVFGVLSSPRDDLSTDEQSP